MEKKATEKKMTRPTWAQVKDLERQVKDLQRKLDSQVDGTSRLVQDCDGWREKYWRLLEENKALKGKRTEGKKNFWHRLFRRG
jgi:predicted RNase H-like nuclease (RuvC/YqgF family)